MDNMDWKHISNLMHWNEPIAKKFGVISIPQTFLIDEDGYLIAKNLREERLREAVRLFYQDK